MKRNFDGLGKGRAGDGGGELVLAGGGGRDIINSFAIFVGDRLDGDDRECGGGGNRDSLIANPKTAIIENIDSHPDKLAAVGRSHKRGGEEIGISQRTIKVGGGGKSATGEDGGAEDIGKGEAKGKEEKENDNDKFAGHYK